MPSNLRDFMNKNNISSSSRDSQEFRRVGAIGEERYEQEAIYPQRYQANQKISNGVNQPQPMYQTNYTTNVYQGSSQIQPKYMKSKNECIEELTYVINEINRKDEAMKRLVESHNSGIVKKFSDDYDNLAQQIIRNVENQLQENK